LNRSIKEAFNKKIVVDTNYIYNYLCKNINIVRKENGTDYTEQDPVFKTGIEEFNIVIHDLNQA